jgi:hypothetical protein
MMTIEGAATTDRGASTWPERPPPVLLIDDDPAGSATTVEWLVDARYPTVAESDGDAVLQCLDGLELLEPGYDDDAGRRR